MWGGAGSWRQAAPWSHPGEASSPRSPGRPVSSISCGSIAGSTVTTSAEQSRGSDEQPVWVWVMAPPEVGPDAQSWCLRMSVLLTSLPGPGGWPGSTSLGSLTRRPHARERWVAPGQWAGSRASMTGRLLPPTPSPAHGGLGQDLGAEDFMVRSAVPMRIWAPALALLCSALPLAMTQSPLGLRNLHRPAPLALLTPTVLSQCHC